MWVHGYEVSRQRADSKEQFVLVQGRNHGKLNILAFFLFVSYADTYVHLAFDKWVLKAKTVSHPKYSGPKVSHHSNLALIDKQGL